MHFLTNLLQRIFKLGGNFFLISPMELYEKTVQFFLPLLTIKGMTTVIIKHTNEYRLAQKPQLGSEELGVENAAYQSQSCTEYSEQLDKILSHHFSLVRVDSKILLKHFHSNTFPLEEAFKTKVQFLYSVYSQIMWVYVLVCSTDRGISKDLTLDL